MDNKRRGGMRRKKVCQFCADKTETIDYKDVEKLKKYVTERGKILANKRESRKNKYIAFSKGLDMLSHNLALNLFNLSKNTDGKITRMEYTYFVSFLGLSIRQL